MRKFERDEMAFIGIIIDKVNGKYFFIAINSFREKNLNNDFCRSDDRNCFCNDLEVFFFCGHDVIIKKHIS